MAAISSSSAIQPLLLLIITAFFSFVHPSSSSHLQTSSRLGKDDGFIASLIHSDNPDSPLYNPNLTQTERINAAVQRDHARQRYLSKGRVSTPNEVQSLVRPDGAEYVMNFSIGTPPVTMFAVADTGSDVIWLQCLPCKRCDRQKLPIFNPSNSKSFERVKCDDHNCGLSDSVACDSSTDTCGYNIEYGDNSHSRGDLALETLTFGHSESGEIKLLSMIIGCGRDNVLKPFGGINWPGVIGLNKDPLSFISQLTITHFSYCFVGKYSRSQSLMRFMSKAILFGGITPIIDVQGSGHYYLNLQGISVGPNRLLLPDGFFNVTSSGDGGFVIDSGTSFTAIKKEALDLMKGEFKRLINLTPGVDRTGNFGPCFKATIDVVKKAAPDLTFHFSGLDLALNKEGTWVDVGAGNVCLAMIPAFSSMSIFGNFQQQNMNVGYDLDKKVISFLKMDTCIGY